MLGDGANSVLGKVRLILEAFEVDDADLSLSELARRSGIPKASVHRLAQELIEWGMLERSGQEYRLGMRAFELGSRVARIRVLRDGVRPFMESLHFATRETVHLAARDGLDVIYLEKITPGRQVTRPSRIAGRMPLHCTATGKVLLAYGPPGTVEDVVARGLTRITPSTVTLPSVLSQQLDRARRCGFATEHEETAIGYCSVAVPLFGASGLLLGAISVTAPVFRADVTAYASALTAVTRRISASHVIN